MSLVWYGPALILPKVLIVQFTASISWLYQIFAILNRCNQNNGNLARLPKDSHWIQFIQRRLDVWQKHINLCDCSWLDHLVSSAEVFDLCLFPLAAIHLFHSEYLFILYFFPPLLLFIKYLGLTTFTFFLHHRLLLFYPNTMQFHFFLIFNLLKARLSALLLFPHSLVWNTPN